MASLESPRGILAEVECVSTDIQAMQASFNTLIQKIDGIRVRLVTNSQLEAERHVKEVYCIAEEKHNEKRCREGSCGSDEEEHSETDDIWSSEAAISVRVPQCLQSRWQTGVSSPLTPEDLAVVDRRITKRSTLGNAIKRAKQLRWDSRWQDLFDSNEQEAQADAKTVGNTNRRTRKSYMEKFNVPRKAEDGWCVLHPHSRVRVVWDVLGLLMIFYDAISIPVITAWDFDFGTVGILLLAINITYWSLDMILSFNTGFFNEATLIFNRRAIALHYLRTWLCADAFLVSLDLVIILSPTLSESGGYLFRSVRSIRILRLYRGLRLFKLSKVFLATEDFLNTYGGNPAVMAVAICKTLGSIYLLAHVAACMWYFIGREKRPVQTWMDTVPNFDDLDFFDQYIRSYYWVLGHLTAAPVDPERSPQNSAELLFTLLLIVSSLLVIGIAISKMSDTVAVLNRANAEANDTKRKLQSYLHTNRFPAEMSVRVVRHALEVHKKKAAMTLDSFTLSLLSSALLSDINAWQRGEYLLQLSLFSLISELHPEAILQIYDACVPSIYADSDIIYKVGTLSERLYITVSGTYALHHFADLSDMPTVTRYEEPQIFCEVSLFAQTRHRSSLMAITFAESVSLQSADFVQSIRLVPSCIGTVYRYARQYMSKLVEVEPQARDAPPIILKESEVAVQDIMPKYLAEDACKVARGIDLPPLSEIIVTPAKIDSVTDALTCILEQDLSSEEIVERLELAFPEINAETGLYTRMSEFAERKRSIGAMLGIIWLSKDLYSSFVECQKEDDSMSYKQWSEWQRFMLWANLSREVIHALLVLLVLRGLGKFKSFVKMVPPEFRTPENIVLYLMDYAPHVVPSVTHLSGTMFESVKGVFHTQKEFNLPQLMQGENTPYQLQALGDCINYQGDALLKFYLLALVGTMCGLTGTVTFKGCMFMNENNARNVLSCITCLMQVKRKSPHAIYWSYLTKRAQYFGLQVDNAQDLVIARLVCLTRASKSDCRLLQEIWYKFDQHDKDILVEHFLADGIDDRAFLLSYLPAYLSNAKSNRVVGLHLGLVVLIDLIMLLQSDGIVNNLVEKVVVVNLSDVATFTNEVINVQAFDTLVGQLSIAVVNGEVRVNIASKHWQASGYEFWRPDPMHEISHEIKRAKRATKSLLVQKAVAGPVATIVEQSRSATVPWSPRVLCPKMAR